MTVDLGAMILRATLPEDEVALAKRLAPLVDELWIVEDLTWAGGMAQMGAILEATDDVIVAHGIAPAPFRNPAALAMEWAALERMYPGRVHAGIGHGVPEWMDWVGEKVGSPLTLLRETIEAVQQLMAGETVTVHGRYVKLRDLTLKFPPARRPLVSAGVVGPKSLHLSGAVADGTIIPESFNAARITDAMKRINEGRAAVGRTDPHRVTLFLGFYCGDLAELPPPLPGDPTDTWGVVGSSIDEVMPDLVEVAATGIDSLVIVPWGADAAQQLDLVRSEIMPRLAQAVG